MQSNLTCSRRNVLKGMSAIAATIPLSGFMNMSNVFNVKDFDVKPNTSDILTKGFQAAVDACAKAGGGVVYVPPGIYMSGCIVLKSNVTLHLSAGAMIKNSPNRKDFKDNGALIFAKGANNISVSGDGILHGNFEAYVRKDETGRYRGGPTGMGKYDPEPRRNSNTSGRPRTVFFIECKDVRLRDINFVNGATWTVHIMGCEDVWLDGITIDNHLSVPNNDGVDMDHCRRVRVSDCNIKAGDDALCFKTTNLATGMGPCEDIVVSNCNLTSRSSAIKLGSAGFEPIRNAVFSNCTISDSNRGVAIQNRDGGIWENITFSQMVIHTRHYEWHRWGASEPIHISNLQRKKSQPTMGKVRGVMFSDIMCYSEAGALFYADPDGSIEDVHMNNVVINIEKPRTERHGFNDLRPSYKHKKQIPIDIAGVNSQGVNGLRLRDVGVRFDADIGEGYSSALKVRGGANLDSSGFYGRSAKPGIIKDIDIK